MNFKSIVSIAFFFGLNLIGYAQKGSNCPEDLIPKLSQNKQWGYTNLFGQWVIQPIYTKVSPYIENKAVVMKGTLNGVIDCEGNIVLSPKYERLTNFRYGKIWAMQKGLWSLLNDKGGTLLPPQFTEINPIPNTELTWVNKDGKWGLFNEEKGQYLCQPKFVFAQIMSPNATLVKVEDKFGVVNHINCGFLLPAQITKVRKVGTHTIIFKQDNKWGLFNEFGKLHLNPEYDSISNKYTDVLLVQKGGYYGLYSLNGTQILAPEYDEIGTYSEGYFLIRKKGKFGYATRAGKIFIKPSYDEAYPFFGKKAIVKTNGKYGVIDIKNKFVLKPEYEAAYRNYTTGIFSLKKKPTDKYLIFSNELLNVSTNGFDSVFVSDSSNVIRVIHNGSYKLFDLKKKDFAVNEAFDGADAVVNGSAKVYKSSKYGIISETGRMIVPLDYDSITIEKWGIRAANKIYQLGKLGVADENGKIIIPVVYEFISFSSPSFLKVKKEKFGVLKTNGAVVKDFVYDFLSNAKHNPAVPEWPAIVSQKNKYGLLNEKGVEVYPVKANSINYAGENYYVIQEGKKYGVLNPSSQKSMEEFQPQFEAMTTMSTGVIAAKKGGKWGYVNTRNEELIPFIYDEAGPFENRFAIVKSGDLYGVINKNGAMVVKPEYTSHSKETGGQRLLSKGGKFFKLMSDGSLL
ncbi:MAG TPA: WG repeat-containing protein [Cytophagaceae bacterium]|jgi:hypothetical protein